MWWSWTGALEKEKRPPRHTELLSLQQLDSSNFCCVVWYKIILIFAALPLRPPTHTHTRTPAKSSHTSCALERSLSDSLRMPGTRWELFSGNITLKHGQIPPAEMRHYAGVERSGEIRAWKMTPCRELSVSVAQRETSGWSGLQRAQTELRRLYKLTAGSLQSKCCHCCWLLIHFA